MINRFWDNQRSVIGRVPSESGASQWGFKGSQLTVRRKIHHVARTIASAESDLKSLEILKISQPFLEWCPSQVGKSQWAFSIQLSCCMKASLRGNTVSLVSPFMNTSFPFSNSNPTR
uniref:Uncharacterized protein n=1 Tax=uncultured marine group II/III euryarchaeote KM3_59_C08 TaxID=1456467 RepID=A0A075H953_9EURY|nr:hypothetical protein [uncultured marine group II/III euryarchaeote KM3_59_C08]